MGIRAAHIDQFLAHTTLKTCSFFGKFPLNKGWSVDLKIVVVLLLDKLIITVAASNSMNKAETGTEVVSLNGLAEIGKNG